MLPWYRVILDIVNFIFRADQGRFLEYIVSWGNLTEEKVALYLTDILDALHYLHGWRIAHLDLKVNVFSTFANITFWFGKQASEQSV